MAAEDRRKRATERICKFWWMGERIFRDGWICNTFTLQHSWGRTLRGCERGAGWTWIHLPHWKWWRDSRSSSSRRFATWSDSMTTMTAMRRWYTYRWKQTWSPSSTQNMYWSTVLKVLTVLSKVLQIVYQSAVSRYQHLSNNTSSSLWSLFCFFFNRFHLYALVTSF